MKGGDAWKCKGVFVLHFITENDSKCAFLDSYTLSWLILNYAQFQTKFVKIYTRFQAKTARAW